VKGDDYKLKTGKYRGQELKNVPASYLIWCYDNNMLWEDTARKFVINNEAELRKLANKN